MIGFFLTIIGTILIVVGLFFVALYWTWVGPLGFLLLIVGIVAIVCAIELEKREV